MNKKQISLFVVFLIAASPFAGFANEDIPKNIQKLFSVQDADSNGSVSLAEFQAVVIAGGKKRFAKAGIEGEELAKKLNNLRKGSQKRFEAADLDANASLDLKEFASTRNNNAKKKKSS